MEQLMKFVTESGDKKLSVSSWKDAGKSGVFVSLTSAGENRGMLLTPAAAELLLEALEAILDAIPEPVE